MVWFFIKIAKYIIYLADNKFKEHIKPVSLSEAYYTVDHGVIVISENNSILVDAQNYKDIY